MKRRILQTLFGLAIGVGAELLLPGHHSIAMTTAAGLSLAGAVSGELAAEKLLPLDAAERAGFATSAMGALAALLAFGIAA